MLSTVEYSNTGLFKYGSQLMMHQTIGLLSIGWSSTLFSVSNPNPESSPTIWCVITEYYLTVSGVFRNLKRGIHLGVHFQKWSTSSIFFQEGEKGEGKGRNLAPWSFLKVGAYVVH